MDTTSTKIAHPLLLYILIFEACKYKTREKCVGLHIDKSLMKILDMLF